MDNKQSPSIDTVAAEAKAKGLSVKDYVKQFYPDDFALFRQAEQMDGAPAVPAPLAKLKDSAPKTATAERLDQWKDIGSGIAGAGRTVADAVSGAASATGNWFSEHTPSKNLKSWAEGQKDRPASTPEGSASPAPLARLKDQASETLKAPTPTPASGDEAPATKLADNEAERESAILDAAKPVDVSGQFAGKFKAIEAGIKDANDPKKWDAYLQKAKGISSALPPEKQKEYETKLATIGRAKDSLIAAYKEDRRSVDWMRVGDILARAVTQLGASMQGQRTGVNMSGVKLDPLDLTQNYAGAKQDLEMGLGREGDKEKLVETDRNRAEKDRDKDVSLEREGILRGADIERSGKLAALQVEKEKVEREMAAATQGGRDAQAAALSLKLHRLDQDAANYRAELAADAKDRAAKSRGTKEMAGAQGEAEGILKSFSAGSAKRKNDKGGKQMAELGRNLDLAGWSAEQRSEMFSGADPEDYKELGVAAQAYMAKHQPAGRPAQAGATRPAAGQSNSAAPAGAPPVGTEKNGWIFQGGDPADKNNWKKKGT